MSCMVTCASHFFLKFCLDLNTALKPLYKDTDGAFVPKIVPFCTI